MDLLKSALKNQQIVYVTRDIERALGLPKTVQNYFIITNNSAFAKSLARQQKNIILVPGKEKLDTRELLAHPTTTKFLKKLTNPAILVFKNTPQIEAWCREHGYRLLNPDAKLASSVEEKISQIHWLGELTRFLPPHCIQLCKDLLWSGHKYIVQFNRAHTGSGTLLIESEAQVKELQAKFPNREVRVTEFVEGPAFTNNNVVWGTSVLPGNINYQITGLQPFTDLPFATIGNDWALPHTLLTKKQKQEYLTIVQAVGKKLAAHGWKGLFGIDTIVDQKTGNVYLIEINARQPASTSFESELQEKNRKKTGAQALTTFEAHLLSLLGATSYTGGLVTIDDGAQIIQRVTAKTKKVPLATVLKLRTNFGLRTISYQNTDPGSDLLRLQSTKHFMRDHGVFNYLGTRIAYLLDYDITRYRAGIFIIKNNKILLMYRNKKGWVYYTIPGGRIERGETLEKTALREGKEETSLRFELDLGREPVTFRPKRSEVYFFTKHVSGSPKIGGPELQKQTEKNKYGLAWIDETMLKKIPLGHEQWRKELLTLLSRKK